MTDNIRIQPLQTKHVEFRIRGTAPLLQHAWSHKAKDMLRMTAAERRKTTKTARDPQGEASAALYTTDDGQYGVPAMAVKAAMITAAHKDFGIAKTDCRKALRFGTSGVVPFDHYSDYAIREDIVRVGNNQTDIRYRPEFQEWACRIRLMLATDIMNETEVVNLANRAGFLVGICEFRPENGGEMGTFEVDPEFGIKVES